MKRPVGSTSILPAIALPKRGPGMALLHIEISGRAVGCKKKKSDN